MIGLQKKIVGKISFELVYGMNVVLHVNLKIPVYKFIQQFTTNHEVVYGRMDQLKELDKQRRKDFDKIIEVEGQTKNVFDKRARQRVWMR
jgi:type III secretory pathway component EscR